MTRYNAYLGESVFRVGRTVCFRPQGKVTCHDDDATASEAKRTRYGHGGVSARIFVGLSVGDEATFTVDDIVETIIRFRKKQRAGPDASVLTQRGIYESKKKGKKKKLVIEDSVQIIILDLAGLPREKFTEQMLKLGEHMLEKFEQESVIVEIQNRGVVVDVYELTP